MQQLTLFDAIAIPLTKGYVALVDPVDSDLAAYKWSAIRNGYATRCKKRQTIYLHRTILIRKIGRDLLPGEIADHINGNTSDNRRDNLRVATWRQNAGNKKMSSANTSSYKGVSWYKPGCSWRAYIGIDGRIIHLGYFDSPIDAALAYDEAARRYFGTFARCNFPAPGDERETRKQPNEA